MLIGSHCGTPKLFPRFVLPGGVEFDKTQKIRCFYTPPGPGTQREITHAAECPQWSNVSANGYYTSRQTGWGWRLAAALGHDYQNGSAWEFWVPVKATSQQWGSQLTTELWHRRRQRRPDAQPERAVLHRSAAGDGAGSPDERGRQRDLADLGPGVLQPAGQQRRRGGHRLHGPVREPDRWRDPDRDRQRQPDQRHRSEPEPDLRV